MMDEMNMETMDNTVDTEEVLDTEIVEDDADYDVVDTPTSDNHGMVKTVGKALVGLGLAVGTALGIRKAYRHSKGKYITSTPAGLIRCK